ncbi:MAG: S8 family serine peptidase [Gammaproteobacteria bacterium]|nr:S8 family serine peptidase [Gammaproteobacteria bacterium]
MAFLPLRACGVVAFAAVSFLSILQLIAPAYGQVAPPGEPPPVVTPHSPALRIGGPVFIPPAIAPSATPTDVTVGATVAGTGDLPPLLYLEEVSSTGLLLGVVAELTDDGIGFDKQAGDGRYLSKTLQLGSTSESERFFRIRAGAHHTNLAKNLTTFAVTDLPIGFPPSDPANTVAIPNGLDRAFINQAVFTTEPGVAPRQVRQVVAGVSADLGNPIEIVGYLPGLNAYRVRFVGDATYEAIGRITQALERRNEIADATPTHVGRPSTDWWLESTNVVALRNSVPAPTGPGSIPVLGSSDIGVAVVELGLSGGVDCSASAGLPCMPAASLASIPQCSGLYPSSSNAHGTKVASLLAEDAAPPVVLDEGGVAPDIRVLPLRASSGADTASVLNCIVAHNNAPGTDRIHVVNMSLESNLGSAPEADLRTAICSTACNNTLMVAAAGNFACSIPTLPFPGRFGESTDTCACTGSPTIGDFVLRVGATTDADSLGDSCAATNMKSHTGDIYAPGWGVPGLPGVNGTSWAAPVVSGCAAVRGAVDVWGGGASAWDASDTEFRLRDTASSFAGLSGGGLLDCSAAIRDPYNIVFLLDRSGSMNRTLGTSTRWDALKNAVDGFTGVLETSAPAGSRFGLTLFSSGISEPMGTSLVDIDSSLQTTVNGHLIPPPSGSTGMGAGLKNAIAKVGAAGRPRVVVLFTDGDQNRPLPTVESTGCTYSDASNVDTGCPAGTSSGSVKIIPVGITGPSSTYLTTLQALANQHRGKLLIADPAGFVPVPDDRNPCAGSIEAAFDCAIAPALYGSSLQMIASAVTVLSPDDDLLRFSVNRDVARLVIKINGVDSSGPDFRRLPDRIRMFKDGVDVSNYFAVTVGATPTSVLLDTDFMHTEANATLPDLPPHGDYVVAFSPVDGGSSTNEPTHTVRIVAFADDHRLDFRWELSPDTPRVGQMLTPRVRLIWAGRPIDNARVVARIFRPGDDMGHVLASHPAVVDVVTGVDAPTPGQQKFDRLWRTDAAFRARLAANENTVELTHQGAGWYTASFDPGDVSGTYQVAYDVTAESAEFGVIEREAAQSAYVRFGEIDMDNSLISRTVQGNTITLTLKPVTATGRLVGPGQAAVFSVAGPDAKIVDITDHQDGLYTLVMSADPESTLIFSILGESVYEGRADFRDQRFRGWWIILLMLLLIASA